MEKSTRMKKSFKFPHTYVILFTIILVMTICSYIIPAGQYERVKDPNTGRTVVDPDSFTYVEQNPVGIFDFLNAIPKGMIETAEIITFIFIVGGSFNIVTCTGAIQAGINKIAAKMNGREKLMIPILMFTFSLGGATFGMSEETIVFIPIGIALARSLGYDAIVGMAMVNLGAAIGFSSGFMNPFTVGVAQGIAELPLFSGIGLRLVVWLVVIIITPILVLRYANKIKQNPELSIVRELEAEEKNKTQSIIAEEMLSASHILVLITLLVGMIFIIVGVMKFDWYVTEIASVFLGIGIVSGIFGRISPSDMAQDFIAGAKDIAMGALIVGLARGILVVMSEGLIIDTVVHALSSLIIGLPRALAAIGMFLIQCLINLFIPSGSGQASATMPIMVPLSDIIGLTRQTAVLAFQFGDGFTNTIIPTHGTLCASLAMAKIPYDKWVKFVAPIVLTWLIICSIFMIIATMTNYGPF